MKSRTLFKAQIYGIMIDNCKPPAFFYLILLPEVMKFK